MGTLGGGVAACLAAAVLIGPGGAVLAAVGAVALVRSRAAAAVRRRADRVRRSLPAVCGALAAELRAGRTSAEALALAARDAEPDLALLIGAAARAARLGGDVPGMLRDAARSPGAGRLAALAAGWELSADTGASLGMLAERLSATLRDEERHRRLVTAQLSGPRASARLLAALPVVGVLLGTAFGAAPLRQLLDTSWGLACLAAAVGLDVLGLWWTERLGASAIGARS